MTTSGAQSNQLLAIIRMQTEIARLGLDLNGVMTLVTEHAQELIPAATGAVVELAEGEEMVYRAVGGAAAGQLGLRLRKATSLSGLSVLTASTLVCNDSESDPRVDREACRRVGVRSMVVVPLLHEDLAVGALKVFSDWPEAFDDADIEVLGLMSELIAAAMYHSARYGADELFRQATTDSLTGLANRAMFLDRMRQGLSDAKRKGTGLAILMMDLDGLKPINDQRGHRAGDAAIQEMARRIAARVRHSDTAARLGGDEFGVLLTGVDSRASARVGAEQLARHCNQPFAYEGASLPFGVSLGMAFFPEDGDDPGALLARADEAMYADKRERKASGPA